MESVKAKAWDFLIRHRLRELPIDCLQLNEIDAGLKIKSYSDSIKFISSLKLTEYAEKHNGFTIEYDKKVIILYNEKMPYSIRNFVIAHEIGHVILGHATNKNGILGYDDDGNTKEGQEEEADAFAYAFLAPSPVFKELNVSEAQAVAKLSGLSLKYADKATEEIVKSADINYSGIEIELIDLFKDYINKQRSLCPYNTGSVTAQDKKAVQSIKVPYILLTLSSITIIIMAVFIYSVLQDVSNQTVMPQQTATVDAAIKPENAQIPPMQEEKPTENGKPFDGVLNENTLVYVTKSGDKYHLPDCSYITGKSDLTEYTKAEAEEKGYSLCSRCKNKIY